MQIKNQLFKFRWLILLCLVVIGFFYPVFQDKYPIPADTVLGMYHPWRDQAWDGYERFPYKNFLITDPVRQTYPYKQLVISIFKKGQLPSWNPYILTGTPLVASLQAGAFYPLNIIFFLLPFKIAWTVFIMLQPLLAAAFMFLYFRNLKFNQLNCFLMSLSWAFCGFMMAWLTWGNIGHTALWLPLVLLSLDKLCYSNKKRKIWILMFIFALSSQFLAGHIQTAFYSSIFITLYIIYKIFEKKISSKKLFLVLLAVLISVIVSLPQWLPTLKLVQLSARQADLPHQGKAGWFLPSSHLVQLIVPDFFGNPATQNYWGVWNYGEFVSYIGVLAFFFALYGILFVKNKRRQFFILTAFSSLVLAVENPLSRFFLKIPVIGTFQPSRLIYLLSFSLIILAAYGFEDFFKNKSKRKALFTACCLVFTLALVFSLTFKPNIFQSLDLEPNFSVSRRNLVLPLGFLITTTFILFAYQMTKKALLLGLLVILLCFDFLRFTHKFTPFVKKELIFPQTKIISFLQEQTKDYPWRVSGIDYLPNQKRILLPNFNMAYQLSVIDGYEPLYLKRFGEFIGLMEWGEAGLSNLSFNRSLIPNNFESRLFDLTGSKYLLALKDYETDKLEFIFQEGETRLYENLQAFPRAFLVYDYRVAQNKQTAAQFLIDENIDLNQVVILEKEINKDLEKPTNDKVEIVKYEPNRVVIKSWSDQVGLLVLTDSWYPTWRVFIDSQESEILMADYIFRAVLVPAGHHEVEFRNKLF